MKLTNKCILNKEKWIEKGYTVPTYDREKLKIETMENPTWLHFGAGNLFRAFPAAILNKMLNEKKTNRGLIVAEGYDYDLLDKVYTPYDNLSVLITLRSNGNIEKEVIGSVVEAVKVDANEKKHWERLKEIFRKSSLQMVSFTITEKGYSLVNNKDELLQIVVKDLENEPETASNIIGKLTVLCYERYTNGKIPISLVSMDNCSHNGSKLYNAVKVYAKAWVEKGFFEKEFLEYIDNSVAFPWTMIDKITPRPDKTIKEKLEIDGFQDSEIIVTSKNSYSAAFVNAEESQYLVIEDDFPNGRPKLEEVRVIFTNKETVDKVEKMKVCTCLNPLHTALAIFGCLLKKETIADEMKDNVLRKLVEKLAYDEAIKVVVDPKIIDPKKFIKEVIEVRFPNPFLLDTPQRIATDTSQKLSIRFGETIKAYEKRGDLDTEDLKIIPLVLAGWIRYLMGIDDDGNTFTVSPDPMLKDLLPHIKNIKLGDKNIDIKALLESEKIFGVNLYKVNLGNRVEDLFKELIAEKGSVKKTLKKYVSL